MKFPFRFFALFAASFPTLLAAQESFHRAEQDREITYWLLDPATHQFRISHDFTVTRPGQKSVHSFVRKGSVVSPDAKMIDLDTGKPLETHFTSLAGAKGSGQAARRAGRVARADADLVAAPEQRRRNMPADESRAAQNQHSHGLPFGHFCLDRTV